MSWTRRHWLAGAAASSLGACAQGPSAAGDRIVDTATGRALAAADVAQRMRGADLVLLGELHDNPHHHVRRARLLADLGERAAVVAEHLPRGAVASLPAAAAGETLRKALEASGFDARGWRWPLHEPLFAAIARAGLALRGGNLEREAARRLAREGPGAMPLDLRPWVDAAPLPGPALAVLQQGLIQGHCGHLGADRLPGMVAAQRGRDAAMAQALGSERERLQALPGHHPVVLLAGNGHVRRDHGVPTLLAVRWPKAQTLSVGFVETAPEASHAQGLYDIVWATPAAARDDPCKAFAAPRAASA